LAVMMFVILTHNAYKIIMDLQAKAR